MASARSTRRGWRLEPEAGKRRPNLTNQRHIPDLNATSNRIPIIASKAPRPVAGSNQVGLTMYTTYTSYLLWFHADQLNWPDRTPDPLLWTGPDRTEPNRTEPNQITGPGPARSVHTTYGWPTSPHTRMHACMHACCFWVGIYAQPQILPFKFQAAGRPGQARPGTNK